MPLLFPNLRISQVFGANTDVGKTLLTTALVRSTALRYQGAGEAAAQLGQDGSKKRVFYLKPVSTGPDNESDVSYVERHTGDLARIIETRNLYQYREPKSPHLAAKLAPDLPSPKSNAELVQGVSRYATERSHGLNAQQGALYVETAGGVHSPSIHSSHTQSTSLLSLRLPSVLIAAPQLGGISTTLSAYESLHLRGYHISAVLCLEHNYYRNHEFLAEYFGDRGIKFWSMPPPPEKQGTVQEDAARLAEWYKSIEGGGASAGQAAAWLDEEHALRIKELEGMPRRTLDSVWWPFTQHGLVNKAEDVMVIDSAEGDHFDAYYAPPASSLSSPSTESSSSAGADSLLKPYFDGAASWFTQSHGHAATPLTLAAAHAAGRYGHVLFPSGTHAPALQLAEKLKETAGKGWADRVFYSDNGSTGTEVALKMAIRAAGRRYGWTGDEGVGVGVIGLRGGYHGDTIGSMDASEPSTFNKAVDWYKGRGHWFSPPIVQYRDGIPTVSTTGPDIWPALGKTGSDSSIKPDTNTSEGWTATFDSLHDIYDLSTRRSSPLATYYRKHIRDTLKDLAQQGRRFGAVMMEPTCLGAGGMLFVDPLFQACLVEVVRASADIFGAPQGGAESYEETLAKMGERDASQWSGLPIVYDEVFSGLHRFGYHTASSVLSQTPDISVYAKILTGGLLPLSSTLASKSIFDAFLSDKKVDALLHGHSYTANPVGCAVALEAINMVDRHEKKGGWEKERALWNTAPASASSTRDSAQLQEQRWSFWHPDFVARVSEMQGVQGTMALGTVCAIELKDDEGGYSSHKALDFLTALRRQSVSPDGPFEEFQIHSRPLGNVLYFMTSLFTEPEVVRAMERAIEAQLEAGQ